MRAMTNSSPAGSGRDPIESDLPRLPKPGERALAQAGYTRLAQFTDISESDLSALHGVGPLAVRRIREALVAGGLSFAGE
jgi:DNA integrity scanning protein DisA with diadenylate cyclase activity